MVTPDGPSQMVTVAVQPYGAGAMPTLRLDSAGSPVVSFGSHPATVDLMLSGLDDPAEWMRYLARWLLAKAHEVDEARLAASERMPEGVAK